MWGDNITCHLYILSQAVQFENDVMEASKRCETFLAYFLLQNVI